MPTLPPDQRRCSYLIATNGQMGSIAPQSHASNSLQQQHNGHDDKGNIAANHTANTAHAAL
jgi:hypothetical protein